MKACIEKDDKVEFSMVDSSSKFYSWAFSMMSADAKLYIEINSNLDVRKPNSLVCDIDHIMNFSEIDTDWEFIKDYIEFKKQFYKRFIESDFMKVAKEVHKERIKNILKEIDTIESRLKPEVQLFILTAN